MSGISPKIPLQYNDEDGHYRLVKTYKEMAQQNLKMLCLTNPGERVMDINFGVGIMGYLFENNGEPTFSEITEKIYEQTSKYLPYIEITDVEITEGTEDLSVGKNLISVSIEYKILPLHLKDVLNIVQELPAVD